MPSERKDLFIVFINFEEAKHRALKILIMDLKKKQVSNIATVI